MANRSRKTPRVNYLQQAELLPITDPAQQAALDRLFKSGRITKRDRKLLEEGRKLTETRQAAS